MNVPVFLCHFHTVLVYLPVPRALGGPPSVVETGTKQPTLFVSTLPNPSVLVERSTEYEYKYIEITLPCRDEVPSLSSCPSNLR